MCAIAHTKYLCDVKGQVHGDEEPREYPTEDRKRSEPCACPFSCLSRWWHGYAVSRVYPGGVLVANLLGSFTLGLLTVVWNAYARRDGEDRIHSFRLLFGAGMMGGYTTYSSIAA